MFSGFSWERKCAWRADSLDPEAKEWATVDKLKAVGNDVFCTWEDGTSEKIPIYVADFKKLKESDFAWANKGPMELEDGSKLYVQKCSPVGMKLEVKKTDGKKHQLCVVHEKSFPGGIEECKVFSMELAKALVAKEFPAEEAQAERDRRIAKLRSEAPASGSANRSSSSGSGSQQPAAATKEPDRVKKKPAKAQPAPEVAAPAAPAVDAPRGDWSNDWAEHEEYANEGSLFDVFAG